MNLRVFLCMLLLPAAIVAAAPQVTDTTAGDVGTTAFSLCWETGEAAEAGVRVFSDAAGTSDITDRVRVEPQFLTADRREVASSPASREAARALQAAMNSRGVFLTRISGLQPDTTYWVRALALVGGSTVDTGPLVEVTTARDTAFLVESRQLVVDFSAAAVLFGDLGGAVVRLENPGSAYPLFAVINDSLAGNRCYFDLNHLLDATGELPLNPASGTTLTLDFALLGMPIPGDFSGNQIAYDGSALAAKSSIVGFTPAPVMLTATSDHATALSGQPVRVDLRATDSAGDPLADFNRTLLMESPAILGGSLTTGALADGVLDDQPVVLTTLGNQTITISDPISGATTTLDFEVLEYTYDNFRLHYYGSTTSPEGDPSGNGDGDSYDNLFEFASGLDPNAPDGPIQFGPGGGLLRRGGPVTTLRIDSDGVDFRVTFLRSKNYQSLGIHYTPQFSSNMGAWFNSSAQPVVLEEDGDMELVTIPYPYFTPEPAKARFFRMEITID
ncbi:hypothetical protein [Haloferula sargassicola]|uniref:Fibronectin type-III domain-containing protein n=1 Tax=Haloferula sargassicola TaxID=490096 RepID=A0ABP9UMW4_9BACT